MALNFPDSPITGERYLAENGVEYIYDAANDTWTGSVDGIVSPANPIPSDITASPDFDSGTGTEQDPYVITPVCVLTPGGTATSKQVITISNQPSFSVGTWEVVSGPVSRFDQPDSIFSGGGIWSGNILYDDIPTTTTAQLYDGLLQIGTAFIRWKVTQTVNVTTFTPADSPNASPATVDYATDLKYGTVTGIYADTPGELTATGAARFTINGGLPLTTGTIADGDALGVLFDTDTVNAAAEGDILEGHIHGQGFYCLVPTITVDRTPDSFSVPPVVDAGISSVATSESFQLEGINCRTHLLYDAAGTTLTDPEASVNGGTFANIGTSGTAISINPGDNIIVRGTTGSVNLTEYTLRLKVSTTIGNWSVTTSNVAASITQPSIISPVNGSAGIVPPLDLLGSTYLPLNGAGAHASSDWQVYEADLVPPSTSVITAYKSNDELYSSVVSNNCKGYSTDSLASQVALFLDGTSSQANFQQIASGAWGFTVALSDAFIDPYQIVIEANASSFDTAGVSVLLDGVDVGNLVQGSTTQYFVIPGTLPNGFKTIGFETNYAGGGSSYFSLLRVGTMATSGTSYDDTEWLDYPTDGATITLSDDENLDLFTAGEAVIQNSGGTPVTSAITNITPTTPLPAGFPATSPQGPATSVENISYAGNAWFVITNPGGRNALARSTDNGTTWTDITLTVPSPYNNAKVGSGSGNKPPVYYNATAPTGKQYLIAGYAEGSGTSPGCVWASGDGISWTAYVADGSTNNLSGCNGVVWDGSKFVAINQSQNNSQRPYMACSTTLDTGSWGDPSGTPPPSSGSLGISQLHYFKGKYFVRNGDNLLVQTDLAANYWPAVTLADGGAMTGLLNVYEYNDTLVCTTYSSNAPVFYTTDGTNWYRGTDMGFTGGQNALGYSNGQWIGVSCKYNDPIQMKSTSDLTGTWSSPLYSPTYLGKGANFAYGSPAGTMAIAFAGSATTVQYSVFVQTVEEEPTVLTLTNDTNLANLRVGDVVTSDSSQTINVTTSAAMTNGTSLLNMIAKGIGPVRFNFDSSNVINFNPPISASSEIKFRIEAGCQITARGSTVTNNTGVTSAILVPGSGTLSTVTLVMVGSKETVNGPYIDGSLSSTQTGSGSNVTGTWLPAGANITAINEATPSITTDGGTWANGDTVTGPLIPAASGTFASADSSVSTMTLSSSTGRWLITEADYETNKKLNKFVKGAGVATLPPGAPTTEPAGSEYTAVVNKDDDTVNKTSFPLTSTEIKEDKAYYSRVRYNSDDTPAVVSDYSEYNEFLTKETFAPTDWILTNTPGGTLNWQGVVYGNDLWVAVSNTGNSTNDIMTSSDGITWASSTSTSLPSGKYKSIAYGDGYYVAVGRTSNIVKSTDGLNWNGSGNVGISGFDSVSFGNNTFVAVDAQGVKYITDITGNGWQSATIPSGSWVGSTFGNGKFVAVGANSTVMYSTNASTWTSGTIPNNQWQAVAYGNGKYVAVANTGSNRVAYSTDGATWTSATSTNESAQWSAITFGGLNFVAVSKDDAGGSAMYSADGINWTAIPTIPPLSYETIAHGDGKFVALARNGSPQQCAYSYGS